jgi:hypothetical protein
MKWALAVTLLLVSFAPVALADGPGMSPPSATATTPKPALLADGPGMSPPSATATAPPQSEIVA